MEFKKCNSKHNRNICYYVFLILIYEKQYKCNNCKDTTELKGKQIVNSQTLKACPNDQRLKLNVVACYIETKSRGSPNKILVFSFIIIYIIYYIYIRNQINGIKRPLNYFT